MGRTRGAALLGGLTDSHVVTFADGKIETYVGAGELGAADNLEAVPVEFLGGARRTLDIAVQEIDSRPIAPSPSIALAAAFIQRPDCWSPQCCHRHVPSRPRA